MLSARLRSCCVRVRMRHSSLLPSPSSRVPGLSLSSVAPLTPHARAASSRWTNRQRTLVFSSRGVSYRARHLMTDVSEHGARTVIAARLACRFTLSCSSTCIFVLPFVITVVAGGTPCSRLSRRPNFVSVPNLHSLTAAVLSTCSSVQ